MRPPRHPPAPDPLRARAIIRQRDLLLAPINACLFGNTERYATLLIGGLILVGATVAKPNRSAEAAKAAASLSPTEALSDAMQLPY